MAKSTELTAVENTAQKPEDGELEFNYIDIADDAGRKYRLQFNRRISEAMEREGFVYDMENRPQLTITTLFRGAFRMHHKGMMPERIDRIWEAQRGKTKLIAYLYALYMKPLSELLKEDEGDDENPTWTVG